MLRLSRLEQNREGGDKSVLSMGGVGKEEDREEGRQVRLPCATITKIEYIERGEREREMGRRSLGWSGA